MADILTSQFHADNDEHRPSIEEIITATNFYLKTDERKELQLIKEIVMKWINKYLTNNEKQMTMTELAAIQKLETTVPYNFLFEEIRGFLGLYDDGVLMDRLKIFLDQYPGLLSYEIFDEIQQYLLDSGPAEFQLKWLISITDAITNLVKIQDNNVQSWTIELGCMFNYLLYTIDYIDRELVTEISALNLRE